MTFLARPYFFTNTQTTLCKECHSEARNVSGFFSKEKTKNDGVWTIQKSKRKEKGGNCFPLLGESTRGEIGKKTFTQS